MSSLPSDPTTARSERAWRLPFHGDGGWYGAGVGPLTRRRARRRVWRRSRWQRHRGRLAVLACAVLLAAAGTVDPAMTRRSHPTGGTTQAAVKAVTRLPVPPLTFTAQDLEHQFLVALNHRRGRIGLQPLIVDTRMVSV